MTEGVGDRGPPVKRRGAPEKGAPKQKKVITHTNDQRIAAVCSGMVAGEAGRGTAPIARGLEGARKLLLKQTVCEVLQEKAQAYCVLVINAEFTYTANAFMASELVGISHGFILESQGAHICFAF